MFTNFFSAFALVFVFEGIIPFVLPLRWKQLLQKAVKQDEKVLRIWGFFSMLAGVVLLTIVHQFVD